jgi:multidrug resistance efflux pump
MPADGHHGRAVRANLVGTAPRMPGRIIRIAVDDQHVQRGDLLFEIDPADFQVAAEQAKARVMAARAALTQRKQDLDRQTELFQKKVNAVQEFCLFGLLVGSFRSTPSRSRSCF